MTTLFDYDADPERFRLAARVTQQHLTARSLYDLLAELLVEIDARQILDIGCGEGALRSALPARRQSWLVGLDASGTMLGAHPPPVVQADATALPFGAGVFDAVVAVNVLDHLPDPTVAIGEAHRVLAPGGSFVAATASRHDSPELAHVWRPPPSSFDAEDAPGLVASVFGQVQVQRWDAPLVRLPDRAVVRDYLVARFVPSEAAADAAAPASTPATITKRGALIHARKELEMAAPHGSTRAIVSCIHPCVRVQRTVRGIGWEIMGTATSTAEPELARWPRLAASPHPLLRSLLPRGYAGFTEATTPRHLVLPATTSVPLVIKLVDSPRRPPAFVMGAHGSSTVVEGDCAPAYVEVLLNPLGAYGLLGLPMAALSGQLVDLVEVLGADGRRLGEQLRAAPGWRQRFALLDRFLLGRLTAGPRPSPEVAWAWERLVASGGAMPIGQLAKEVGWSHKHLISRFRQQVGLRPKTAARLIRFDRVLGRLDERRGLDWGLVAREAGYADQAHLIRDFQQFTGTTPTAFAAATTLPGDGERPVNFVQDAAAAAF